MSGHSEIENLVNQVEKNTVHRVVLKPWDNQHLILQLIESLKLHEALNQQNIDPLTGLFNRNQLNSRLHIEVERALRHSRPLSIMIIDVDHFKSINDDFGHPKGDEVLRLVSQTLIKSLRNIDMVFRYGGDEFLILLPETEVQFAFDVAERIRNSVHSSLVFSGTIEKPKDLSVSIGLANTPLHAKSAATLIDAADKALYVAKGRGRDQSAIASS